MDFIYPTMRWLCKTSARVGFGMAVSGMERLPFTGGALVVGNHASYLDPPFIGSLIPRMDVYYLARESLHRFPLGGWFLRQIHTIPIRTRGDWREGMREAIDALKGGRVVVAFPEGTRTQDGHLQKPKPGLGYLAFQARVTVIPAYITGTFQALPKGSRMLKSSRVKVVFGPPLDLNKWYEEAESRSGYEGIANAMMEGIRAAGQMA